MNKLWDEAELKWIKKFLIPPNPRAAPLNFQFHSEIKLISWFDVVLCNSHKICFAETKQTELKKSLKKNPTNAHRMLQELPNFSRCCGDDSLGSLAGKQVSQWHQHQVRWRSVCVPIHSCVNVSHFRKNLPRSERFCTECVSSQGGEGWSNVCSKQEQLQKQCPSLRLHLPPVCNTLKDNYWICFPHLCGPVSLCYFTQL